MRLRNDVLRDKIRKRHAELTRTMTVGDNIISILGREFASELLGHDGKPTRNPEFAIRYYLRDPRQPGDPDRRQKYRASDIEPLALLNPKELKAYAICKGVSYRSIYDAIRRYHKHLEKDKNNVSIGWGLTRQDVEKRGYINFGSEIELHSFKEGFLTVRSIRRIAKYIKKKYNGLSLMAPNYLVHPLTSRRYAMTLQEQVVFLKDPDGFLSRRAKHISQSWETCELKDFFIS